MDKSVDSRPVVQCIGWYDRGNFGDQLMQTAFESVFDEFKMVFSDGEIQDSASAVILGGGDVCDKYFVRNIWNCNKPLFMFGAGLRAPREIENIRDIPFRWACVRTEGDRDAFQKMGLQCRSAPDITFGLWRKEFSQSVNNNNKDMFNCEKKKLMIILNDEINARWRRNDTRESVAYFGVAQFLWENIAKAASIWENEWWTVWPVFSRINPLDKYCIYDITQRMNPPLNIYESVELNSFTDAINVYSSAMACVSMRFHGAILSAMFAIPFVALSTARKTDLFMKENDLSEFLLPSNGMSFDDIMHKFDNCVENQDISKKLYEVSLQNHSALLAAAAELKFELQKAIGTA